MGTMQYSFLVFLALCAAASWTPTVARVINKRAAFYLANDTMCIVDGDVYRNGDPVPTDDECERCTCRPPGFSCVLRDCDTKPGCKAVRRAGECCPEYVCGCVHNNRVYEDGEIIKDLQNNCYTCRCHGSSISCTFAECLFRGDCPPEYVPGECCPRYDHCPPLSTTSSSTIFTTESSTQSEFVQQQQVFVNLTTQHLEKFTDEGTTLTVLDILPSSTTTTTTQSYSEETSTTTTVTVKFTLTDGAVTSITDLDLNALTTLLPLQTSTYTETTKYILPDENQSKLTTTQASTSDSFDVSSSKEEVLFSTETTESEKEEFFTSTTNSIIESTKATTPTPVTLLEQGTSEKIPDTHDLDENTSEIRKNESVPFDNSTDLGLEFVETDDHSNTPTDPVIIDSSTTSYESTQIFDREETHSDEEFDSANIPSETSDGNEVHSSTIDKDDKLLTENTEKTQETSTTTKFSSVTDIVKDEINLFPESLHNVSSDSDATEFVTIASHTEESTEHEYESTKASTTEGTHEPSSEFTEMLDGEETFSTDKLDQLSVATDISGLSSETSSTEKSRETTLALESTTIQSSNQPIEGQETTTEQINMNSQDEKKYFSTQQTKEKEENEFSTITIPATEISSEMDESFVALDNESHEISSSLQHIDTTLSVEKDVTEDWKITTQHTDSIESQTSSFEDKQSTNEPSEYSTDSEISTILKNFTEIPLFSSENSTETENMSTETEAETTEKHEIYSSTITSTPKTTEQPLISDTPHVSDIELSETIHKDSSDDTLEEDNTGEQTSSESHLLTILDSETPFSTDDTNISDDSEEFSTTVKEMQNTSSVSIDDNISVETSSIETNFDVFKTNYESTTREKISDVSPDMTPETISNSALDGNKFVTETSKTDSSTHENISESSIFDLSENSKAETHEEVLDFTTSASIENEESTDLSFMENSGSELDLDFNSVSTTDSNQIDDLSISEITTEGGIIQNAETETTSESSTDRIKITSDSLTDTDSNESESDVTTLMDQTEEDVLESETSQSNFDTIVSNQQTTKSGEVFDHKLSKDSTESGISKLVSYTTESISVSTFKHVVAEDNSNTINSADINSSLGSTDTHNESGLEVTSSLNENDVGETSQFLTSVTNDVNMTSLSLFPDTKTKEDDVTKTSESQSQDSTDLSPNLDVVTTTISVDVNDASLIGNGSEIEGSDGFNNELTSTLSNDNENSISESNTSIVISPSNDVPALNLLDQENNETNFSTTTTSKYSDYTAPDEQTESSKLEPNFEEHDLEFTPKLSDHQGTTFVNDEDYSAMDSEENFSVETKEHSTHDATPPSESEENKSVSDETESFFPGEFTFHQTKDSTLSTHKNFINEENDSDATENILQDADSDEINTEIKFAANSEENAYPSTVHIISNSYSTEEIHSNLESVNTKSEDVGKFSTNVENEEKLKLDITTPIQDDSNTQLTTASIEQTSSNAKNTFVSIDEFEDYADEATNTKHTQIVEDFTNPSFQPAWSNSHPVFHDNYPLSKSNESEIVNIGVDVDDHTSKFENDEISYKTKEDISANETIYIDFKEGNSFNETFEGEEALSSENTIVTEKNAINFSDEFDLPNQGKGNGNSDKSDLPLLSVISSNDNPSYTSTSISTINNIPNEESTHTEIEYGDNNSTSNVEILFGQHNDEFESSESPDNILSTLNTSAVTENKENESNEELSTVDENTFGEAMHEYSDDHDKYDILKLSSTASQNMQTTNHDQSFDNHDVELDSEEETTEFLNFNVTKPSISYRVETARNLDDSTTSDNLSMGNESNSLNGESLTEDEVSITQSDEKNSNIFEIASDTSINPTTKTSYLHDDSKIFNEMGDHFSGGNLYSEFIIPSNEILHKSNESPQQNLSNITESEISEVDVKKDIEHISSENVSNSATYPKNTFEAYGYLGGVFITGNSKYIDHKESSHEIPHSSNDIVESQHNIEASENSSLILDSEKDTVNINEDLSELESEIGNETVMFKTTADPAQHFGENNFGYTDDHGFDNQSGVKQINSTQNELQIDSTENIDYNISSNTSSLLPNITKETSEKQNFQISVESSKNSSGPEKGGEWLEPTLTSSNDAFFLHSHSEQINANENTNSFVKSDDYSPSVNTSEQSKKGPEKGGELIEPTISNSFHLDQKPGQNEKTYQSSDEFAAESHTTIENSNVSTNLPLYVLSRGKENNHSGASQFNLSQKSDSKESDTSDIHSNYLIKNNSQIDRDNSTKKVPSFLIAVFNESNISLNNSEMVFTKPLNEAEESNLTSGINESILMSDENRENLLQPYSLIDVISNVFKAPGYDSEVHSHFLKEQANYSGKEEPLVVVKRNADTSQERIVFEKETTVKPDHYSKLYHEKTNPHVLQTKKTISSGMLPASFTNTGPHDPPPSKVTSSFIFVVSPNDDNSDALKPSSSSSSSAQEVELPNDNMFPQKTRN